MLEKHDTFNRLTIYFKYFQIPGTEIVVEKGTVLYAVLPALHEDPDFHEDPLKYDPDRFSEERKKDIKPYTYMPFGEGPRICIGK